MPIAQQISPHIPYLRRYARALTGSQKSGDAYVAALLESLLADTSIFPTGMDPRVALYHAFTNLWKSVRINAERTQGEPDQRHNVDAKLEVMTPLARQAFLLMTVEEFELLHDKAGMPASAVIAAATLNGAKAAGQEKAMGTIEPGKLANMVVLSKNPLEDVRNMRSVTLTVKRGKQFPRADYGN